MPLSEWKTQSPWCWKNWGGVGVSFFNLKNNKSLQKALKILEDQEKERKKVWSEVFKTISIRYNFPKIEPIKYDYSQINHINKIFLKVNNKIKDEMTNVASVF